MELMYYKELKTKNAITKIEKITENNIIKIKVYFKQYDVLTGVPLQEQVDTLNLEDLKSKKAELKLQIDQINAVLTEVKEALN